MIIAEADIVFLVALLCLIETPTPPPPPRLINFQQLSKIYSFCIDENKKILLKNQIKLTGIFNIPPPPQRR